MSSDYLHLQKSSDLQKYPIYFRNLMKPLSLLKKYKKNQNNIQREKDKSFLDFISFPTTNSQKYSQRQAILKWSNSISANALKPQSNSTWSMAKAQPNLISFAECTPLKKKEFFSKAVSLLKMQFNTGSDYFKKKWNQQSKGLSMSVSTNGWKENSRKKLIGLQLNPVRSLQLLLKSSGPLTLKMLSDKMPTQEKPQKIILMLLLIN